jgi:hypothetical protein
MKFELLHPIQDIVPSPEIFIGHTKHTSLGRTVSIVETEITYLVPTDPMLYICNTEGENLEPSIPFELVFVPLGDQKYGVASDFFRSYSWIGNDQEYYMCGIIPGEIHMSNQEDYIQSDGNYYITLKRDEGDLIINMGKRFPFIPMDISISLKVKYDYAVLTGSDYPPMLCNQALIPSYSHMGATMLKIMNIMKKRKFINKKELKKCDCLETCNDKSHYKERQYKKGYDPISDLGYMFINNKIDLRSLSSISSMSEVPYMLINYLCGYAYYINDFNKAFNIFKNLCYTGTVISGTLDPKYESSLDDTDYYNIGVNYVNDINDSLAILENLFKPLSKKEVVNYTTSLGAQNLFRIYLSNISVVPSFISNTLKDIVGPEFNYNNNLAPYHAFLQGQMIWVNDDGVSCRDHIIVNVGGRETVTVKSLINALTSNLFTYDVYEQILNGSDWKLINESDASNLKTQVTNFPEGHRVLEGPIVVSRQEAKAFLAWQKLNEPNYDLFTNNCQTMSKRTADFFLSGKLPEKVTGNGLIGMIGGVLNDTLIGKLITFGIGLL